MRVKRRTGSLTEKVSYMQVSKPVYFLMLLVLVAGLLLVNTTHVEFSCGLIKSEADLKMIETLASGGSALFGGDVEEALGQITKMAQKVQKYFDDGKVSCSVLDLYSLVEMDYIKLIVFLIYIIGIGTALVPLFVECDWKARYLIPANLAPVASMALLVLAMNKMDAAVDVIDSLLGSGVVEVFRTTELTTLIIVSAFNLIFAASLVVGIVTSRNTED